MASQCPHSTRSVFSKVALRNDNLPGWKTERQQLRNANVAFYLKT